jgi:signal transduction histidine kinase
VNAFKDQSLDATPEGLPARGSALAWRLLIMAFTVMVIGMLSMGTLVSWRIERGVTTTKADSSTLLIANFMAPHLQELAYADALSERRIGDLNDAMLRSGLRAEVATFRIWKQDGRVVYSDKPELIGRKLPQNVDGSKAWSGTAEVRFGSPSSEEEARGRASSLSRLEILAPIRDGENGAVIAVVELHEHAGALEAELAASKWQIWLVTALITLSMMGCLLVIVALNGRIIGQQRQALSERGAQLSELLRRNRILQGRVERAARKATEDNERLLRRMGYDLHDGVAQLLSLALLRLDRITAFPQDRDNLQRIHRALSDALGDIRNICKGLVLPEVQNMSLRESLVFMIRSHERRTGTTTGSTIAELPDQAPEFVKIALCRFIQETLNNAFKHAGGRGQRIDIAWDGISITIEVANEGPGMGDTSSLTKEPGLGLAGLRYRIESIGGSVMIRSTPDAGTCVSASLPLLVGVSNAA